MHSIVSDLKLNQYLLTEPLCGLKNVIRHKLWQIKKNAFVNDYIYALMHLQKLKRTHRNAVICVGSSLPSSLFCSAAGTSAA